MSQDNNIQSIQFPLTSQANSNPQEDIDNIQKALIAVGGNGKYQKLTFVLYLFSWHLLGMVLLGFYFFFDITNFQCPSIKDQKKCQQYVCDKDESQWKTYLPKDHVSSMRYTFGQNIYMCDKYQNLISLVQSQVYIGSILGFLIIPYIGDNYGRKKGILIAWSVFLLGCISVSFSWNLIIVGIGFFLAGFGVNSATTLQLSLISQQYVLKFKGTSMVACNVLFALGTMTSPAIFLLNISWRVIAIYIFTIPVGIVFLLSFFLLESPKFLLNQDIQQARKVQFFQKVINKIAQINGKQQIGNDFELQTDVLAQGSKTNQYGIWSLFYYGSLRIQTICLGLIFLIIQLNYYGMIFSLKLSKNIQVQQIIIGLSQASNFILLVAYFTSQFSLRYIGRKTTSIIGNALVAIFAFLIIFIHSDQEKDWKLYVMTVFLFLMKLFLCWHWGTDYIYISELFPTSVRSIAFGFISLMGTIGSAISPNLVTLMQLINVYPMIIFCASSVIGILLSLPLRQTKDKATKDNIEQMLQNKIE